MSLHIGDILTFKVARIGQLLIDRWAQQCRVVGIDRQADTIKTLRIEEWATPSTWKKCDFNRRAFALQGYESTHVAVNTLVEFIGGVAKAGWDNGDGFPLRRKDAKAILESLQRECVLEQLLAEARGLCPR